ncbi:MAG: Mth938-like domain-containing protein [Burkholderiales bacterium]
MKFHLTQAAGQNLFTAYGDGFVAINHQRFDHPVLVAPSQPVTRWDASSVESLTPTHFEPILEFKPEIVILGTGDRLRFPKPDLTRALAAAAVGFEAMDTKAACRTFNILMAEGRQVVAAILI